MSAAADGRQDLGAAVRDEVRIDLASPAGAGSLLEERGEALQVVRRVEAQVSREAAFRLGQRLQNRIAAARRRRADNVTVPYFGHHRRRSEEHTSELQSLMRTSYAVFC